jgi:hypothetical protein
MGCASSAARPTRRGAIRWNCGGAPASRRRARQRSSLPVEERRWEHLESLSDTLCSREPTLVKLEIRTGRPNRDLGTTIAAALGDGPVALAAPAGSRAWMPVSMGVTRARVVQLSGLDVDGVRRLAAAETTAPVDAVASMRGQPAIRCRAGVVRSPDGGVIGEVLERSLDRFSDDTRALLATAAVAGSSTPLALLALANSCTMAEASDRLDPAVREGVIAEVAPSGVRFHHALLAEAATRLGDAHDLHGRLATAWDTAGTLDGRASAGHRLRAQAFTAIGAAVEAACQVATELVVADQQPRAAGLLDARDVGQGRGPPGTARTWLSTWPSPGWATWTRAGALPGGRRVARGLTPSRARRAAPTCGSPLRARPSSVRRLEDALGALPSGRASAPSCSAPDDHRECRRRRSRPGPCVGRGSGKSHGRGDPTLVAESLVNLTITAKSRSEVDDIVVGADEVIRLADRVDPIASTDTNAEPAASSTAATSAPPTSHWAAPRCSPFCRQPDGASTLVQRTTLSREWPLSAATRRCTNTRGRSRSHRTGRDPRGRGDAPADAGGSLRHTDWAEEIFGPRPRSCPRPVLQVQKGFGAQLFGDETSVHDVIQRFGSRPERLVRSTTGDHLLRVFGDTVARAGATAYAATVYRALLPWATRGLVALIPIHTRHAMIDFVYDSDGTHRAFDLMRIDPRFAPECFVAALLMYGCLDHLAGAMEAGEGDVALRGEPTRRTDRCRAAYYGRKSPGAGSAARPARCAATRRNGVHDTVAMFGCPTATASANSPGSSRRRASRSRPSSSRDEPTHRSPPDWSGSTPRRSLPAAPARAPGRGRRCRAVNDLVRERAHAEMDALLRGCGAPWPRRSGSATGSGRAPDQRGPQPPSPSWPSPTRHRCSGLPHRLGAYRWSVHLPRGTRGSAVVDGGSRVLSRTERIVPSR